MEAEFASSAAHPTLHLLVVADSSKRLNANAEYVAELAKSFGVSRPAAESLEWLPLRHSR